MGEPHWLVQEMAGQAVWSAIVGGSVWVWTRHGDKLVAVYRTANRELTKGIVWCQVALAELSNEPRPPLEDADVAEALEAARELLTHLDAVIRNLIRIPAVKYEPMKVRWIPPKYTYAPMRMEYVPMRWTVRNGLPHILSMPTFKPVPARWNVKPGRLHFTPGRFTIA